MTLEEKAKAYVESLPPIPADDIHYAMGCAYINGATEALASQWHDPKEELPEDGEKVFVLFKNSFGVDKCFNGVWTKFKPHLIRYWMRIPPVKGGCTMTDLQRACYFRKSYYCTYRHTEDARQCNTDDCPLLNIPRKCMNCLHGSNIYHAGEQAIRTICSRMATPPHDPNMCCPDFFPKLKEK